MSKIIGKFVPKENNEWNEEFEVQSKEDWKEGAKGEAFEGIKDSGAPYHVYSEYWEFVPKK